MKVTHESTNLKDIYPHLTRDELLNAEANLERYLAVMIRIADRMRSDGIDLTSPDLTSAEIDASMPNTGTDL